VRQRCSLKFMRFESEEGGMNVQAYDSASELRAALEQESKADYWAKLLSDEQREEIVRRRYQIYAWAEDDDRRLGQVFNDPTYGVFVTVEGE